MKTFQDKLQKIENSDLYPFHMPGHKRQIVNQNLGNPYLRDITEIDGYDNLHCASDFILQEQQFAANLFGAEESFYLVNGSSCGILSAIATVSTNAEKTLLINRNAHKSVYNALYLFGKRADYIYPTNHHKYPFGGSIDVDYLREMLQEKEYEGILITSPTYEGVVSDIATICEVAHQMGIPVIVDEAHGAHLGIFGGNEYFPQSAIKSGADIVIQSVHKTLPCMTQTALLHVQGDLIDRSRLKMNLAIFQSSSPSYILMESISDGLHYCAERRKDLLDQYIDRLDCFYKKVGNLKKLHVFTKEDAKKVGFYDFDPGKLVICLPEGCIMTGKELNDCLREKYHLQPEMSEARYIIAMTSIMDTDKGFTRLADALIEIDAMLSSNTKEQDAFDIQANLKNASVPKAETFCSIKSAMEAECDVYDFTSAVGKISAEYVFLYPPGIPIVAPGERITQEIMDYLLEKKEAGLTIQGPVNWESEKIACIKE